MPEERRRIGQGRADGAQVTVHGAEEPDGRAAAGERKGERQRRAREPGPPEQDDPRGHDDRDRVDEVRPPCEPPDEAGHEERPGATRGRRAPVHDAQPEEQDEQREDRDQAVVEARVVGPLEENRGGDEREDRRPPAVGADAPGQEGAERDVEERQGERQEAEGAERRAQQSERQRVKVAVDGPHVRLPVEVDEKLAGQRAPAHQAGRALVEPEDGGGGRRQAHEDARGRGAEERHESGPPHPRGATFVRICHASRLFRFPATLRMARNAVKRRGDAQRLTRNGRTG